MSFLLELAHQQKRPLKVTDRHRARWSSTSIEAQTEFADLVYFIRQAGPIWRQLKAGDDREAERESEGQIRFVIDLLKTRLESWTTDERAN